MSEYKPWKDGTVTPKQGTLRSLKDQRCNIMDPWPLEESKSKVECTRVLHRMREQLNIVINLQSKHHLPSPPSNPSIHLSNHMGYSFL